MTPSPRPEFDQLAPAAMPPLGAATSHGPLETAESMAHRAAERTRAQAGRLLDAGSAHIRERPVQSMLIAAATGAALVLLLELAVRAASSSR